MAPSNSGLMWKAYTRPFSAKLWGFVFIIFLILAASVSIASYGCMYIEVVQRKRALRGGKVNVREAQSPGDWLEPTRQDGMIRNSRGERGGKRLTCKTQSNMTELDESGYSLRALLSTLQDTYERRDATSSAKQIRRRTPPAMLIPFPVSHMENDQGSRFDQWYQDSFLLVWSSFMQQGMRITKYVEFLKCLYCRNKISKTL